nr:MAG TPA: hypothetical protein [Caudoviricetes sp.]
MRSPWWITTPWWTTPRAARTHAPRARRRCRHRHRLPAADKSSVRGLLPFWPRTDILSFSLSERRSETFRKG